MSFWGVRPCCCGSCPEPDQCELEECDISETEWLFEHTDDPPPEGETIVEAGQTVRWSASVGADYELESNWTRDLANGADAPSVKLETDLAITTSGANGSVSVVDYLLFPEAVFTPSLSEPISQISICVNVHGKQRYTAEDETKSNYPVVPVLLVKQGDDLFVTVGSDDPIDYRCFSKWTKTVNASDLYKLVIGESEVYYDEDEHPVFTCPGEDIQVGIGFLHQVFINASGTSVFKSLRTVARFDNACVTVSRSVPCYPSRPDLPDLAMTIAGTSTLMDGSCVEPVTDVDGTYVLPADGGLPGTWFNSIFPDECYWLWPGNPTTFSQIGTLLWDCDDGDQKQVAMWLSVYSEGGGPAIGAQIGFYRRTGGPGVLYFWFEYGVTGEFDCDETIELSIVGSHTVSTFGSPSFSAGATTYTLVDGTGPDFAVTVPSTITLDHA